MRVLLAPVAALLLLSGAAFADDRPPNGALPLSQVLRELESTLQIGYFKEIEWDDDHWEIEFVTVGGEARSVEVDPLTGKVR